MRRLGTCEVFGENVRNNLGLPWNSPLETLESREEDLLARPFPSFASHYSELTPSVNPAGSDLSAGVAQAP